MTKHVLLTGASGFVGSHVLRHFLENTDWEIVCPVSYRHRGNSSRITSALVGKDASRVTFFMHDLTGPFSSIEADKIGDIDYIVNVASESHVDRSIADPVPFVRNNVDVALNVLELARSKDVEKLIQVSTDEVYGPADSEDHPDGHSEWSPIVPSNPYSASKAAQEAIAISYWRTYGVPLIITNTMNLFGEMQDSEKFIPKTISRILAGEPAVVHTSPEGVSGSRFYLHARNQADALMYILNTLEPARYSPRSRDGDGSRPLRLNVVGSREIYNDEMVGIIARELGMDAQIDRVNFHESRPGHDLRYGLDGRRLSRLGWQAPVPFEASLARTIRWTLDHPEWLR